MDIYSPYKSKYERWYYNITNNAKSQSRKKDKDNYYENHHIIPLSIGGLDVAENLVLLTYREHLLCHWLLYKFTEGKSKYKMAHAFWAMCNYKNENRKHTKTPFRILEAAKIAHTTSLSKSNTGKGNPMYGTKGGFFGKKHTEEHKQKISGEGNGMYGKTHSKEARERIAEAQRLRKGETKSNSMRSKLSETTKGRKRKYLEDGSWTWSYPS